MKWIKSHNNQLLVVSLIALLTLTIFSAYNGLNQLNIDLPPNNAQSEVSDTLNENIMDDQTNVVDLPADETNRIDRKPLQNDSSLLSKFGLSSESHLGDSPMAITSTTIPQIGSTTFDFEYLNGKIVSIGTETIITGVTGIFITVANLTTSTGLPISQSVQGLGSDDSLSFGFGGATVNRYNYSGLYKLSIAIYSPVTESPTYDLVNSAISDLGVWDASDFVTPISAVPTFKITPKDSDGSGKFDQLYVDGQISILNYSGQLNIVSVIWGASFFDLAAYNETIQTVSADQTLNFNLTLQNTIIYSLEEAETLFWAFAFGDFDGVYEIYYDMFYVDPDEFDPPKVSFTMDHQLVDTDSNFLYNILRGTYNIAGTELDIEYSIDIYVQADSFTIGSASLSNYSIVGNQIQLYDIEMESLSFSEFVGEASINALMHIEMPTVVDNEVIYEHIHINKYDTIFLNYTEFESSPITMNILEFGGLDTDSDGLYNEFLVSLEFFISTDYDYINVNVYLYEIDPQFGSKQLGSDYEYRYFDESWDGKMNLTITKNKFLLEGSNNSLIQARIQVNVRPTSEALVSNFEGRRFIEKNFNISQFDPPPVDIVSVIDYLRDTNGNGLAEELVLQVKINITEQIVAPELSGYFTNGSGSNYLSIFGGIGVYSIELNFTYLSLIAHMQSENGSFAYKVRINDYTLGGDIRQFEGVTNQYSISQFEELPAKFIPNSMAVEFLNLVTEGEGKNGYDTIRISVDINLTTNDLNNFNLDLQIGIKTENSIAYSYFQNQNQVITGPGIITVTFELEGWRFYNLKYEGNLSIHIQGHDYLNDGSFSLKSIAKVVEISSQDFDPPDVIIDFDRSITASTRDVDNNGLTDFLDIIIPLKVYGDLEVSYSVYLSDGVTYYIDNIHDNLFLSYTDPQDLVVTFSSGVIRDKATAGIFQIWVRITETENWEEIVDIRSDIGTFDPDDFDTRPASLPDTIAVNSYVVDIDGDTNYDWLIFEFEVEIRVPDVYYVVANFRMEYGFRSDTFSTISKIDPLLSGSLNVTIRVNGFKIRNFQADEVFLTSIRLEDSSSEQMAYRSLSTTEAISVDYNQFQSKVNSVPTSVIDGDFALFQQTFRVDPEINNTRRFVVRDQNADNIVYDEYRNGGSNPSSSRSVDIKSRYIWEGKYFIIQLDPSTLGLGIWIDTYYEPAQIIGIQSMEIMGATIDVWVATDGSSYFYYDVVNGLLVMEEYQGYVYNILIDSNFELGEIREVPTYTTTSTTTTSTITTSYTTSTPPVTTSQSVPSPTTPITSTQTEKKSEKLNLNAPNLVFILLGLFIVGSIRKKWK